MNHSRLRRLVITGFTALLCNTCLGVEPPVEAVTFALSPGVVYVPLNEAARELRWKVVTDEVGRCVRLGDLPVATGMLRTLVDGTELLQTGDLQLAGATLSQGEDPRVIVVQRGFHRFTLITSPKQVEVSLSQQQLKAWQGGRLVLQTHISSGRNGRTPAGVFSAGPFRARMHRSSLYHNAPMPWSVQINGNVFIHGFTEVPSYPASHGCIRMPLDGGNPARFFYEWVDTGTPVVVRQ